MHHQLVNNYCYLTRETRSSSSSFTLQGILPRAQPYLLVQWCDPPRFSGFEKTVEDSRFILVVA